MYSTTEYVARYSYQFTCPKCGCHILNEVVDNVTGVSEVMLNLGPESIEFGNCDNFLEDVCTTQYECSQCNFVAAVDCEHKDLYELDCVKEEKEPLSR